MEIASLNSQPFANNFRELNDGENTINIVRAILGIEDPVSIPSGERHKQTRANEFFNAEEEDLIRAYLSIPVREKQPHFDTLEFLINVRNADAYQKSGELWKAFGDCETPQLVNIQMDAERHTGILRSSDSLEEADELQRSTPENMGRILHP